MPTDDTPDISIVTEPEDFDLDISTGFFFPDAKKDRSGVSSNLTAKGIPPIEELDNIKPWLDPPEDLSPSPIDRAQGRSRILVGTIGLAIALSICVTQYSSRYGNPAKFLPEPVKVWLGMEKPKTD